VSDRGLRHHRNEDAFAVAADAEPGSRAVLVVCDGVSSAKDSDVASLAAAEAARAVLAGSRAQGLGTDDALVALVTARMSAAADAAALAVVEATTSEHGDNPPSCTFVAAVLEGRQIVAAVVGDSRAYWLPDAGEAIGLTVDDSWAAELIASGVPRAQAEAGSYAHAITRWLGVDAPDHQPRVTSVVADSPGWLLVCSDGLWNYCSPPGDLAALVRRTAADAAGEPLATATALVDWANAQGGHDNITVALARVDG
jgi:serine/threonine protein phosphatase PrpC